MPACRVRLDADAELGVLGQQRRRSRWPRSAGGRRHRRRWRPARAGRSPGGCTGSGSSAAAARAPPPGSRGSAGCRWSRRCFCRGCHGSPVRRLGKEPAPGAILGIATEFSSAACDRARLFRPTGPGTAAPTAGAVGRRRPAGRPAAEARTDTERPHASPSASVATWRQRHERIVELVPGVQELLFHDAADSKVRSVTLACPCSHSCCGLHRSEGVRTLGSEARHRHAIPKATMQRIVVLNPKGGSGKTTIAINLASYLASLRPPAGPHRLRPAGLLGALGARSASRPRRRSRSSPASRRTPAPRAPSSCARPMAPRTSSWTPRPR